MPRVHHVRKARKSYPHDGIEKGQEYWWWQFAFGRKIRSAKPPKRSQLTQSSFLSTLWDLQDNLANRFTSFDSLEDDKQALIDDLENMKQECEDSLQNMPESLQDSSSSGELLQERIYDLEQWINELECVLIPYDDGDWDDEGKKRVLEDVKEQILESDNYF